MINLACGKQQNNPRKGVQNNLRRNEEMVREANSKGKKKGGLILSSGSCVGILEHYGTPDEHPIEGENNSSIVAVALSFIILGGISKFILTNFGLKYASIIGYSYDALLTVLSASLITTLFLVITYTLSERSVGLVRASLFEVLFNGSACLNFFGSCSWLLMIIQVTLNPTVLTAAFSIVYSLILMVNVLGFLLAVFYGIDGYLAYKHFMRSS